MQWPNASWRDRELPDLSGFRDTGGWFNYEAARMISVDYRRMLGGVLASCILAVPAAHADECHTEVLSKLNVQPIRI